MSVILWRTPADCLSTAAVFPPRSKWKGQGRGVLYVEVLPDVILSLQYWAKVLDMDQQCSERMAEKSKTTQYWFDSPFAVIVIIYFIFFFFRNSAGLQQTAFCYCLIFSILTLWARAPASVFLAPCCLFLWAT